MKKWDVFISYASEERITIARPLAELLRGFGVSVWYDESNLQVGDSLREKIDEGLSKSKFGIVLFSEAFFSKRFPLSELNGLFSREMGGEEIILPVWVNIDEHTVREHSPMLADRVAIRFEDPISTAWELVQVIRPDLHQAFEKKRDQFPLLERLRSGQEVSALQREADMAIYFNDDPTDENEVELVANATSEIHDCLDYFGMDLDPGEAVRQEYLLTGVIENLEANGWALFGGKRRRPWELAGEGSFVNEALFGFVRGNPDGAYVTGNSMAIVRVTENQATNDDIVSS